METRRCIQLPEASRKLGQKAKENDIPIYAVGGSVRNTLLGLPVRDYDLCGPNHTETLALCAGEGIRISDTVNGLGTSMVLVDGESFEYTAFRIDNYPVDGAHRPETVVFTSEIGVDALRRDFTVNALYASLYTGEVLDPLGMGNEDLETGTIRMVRGSTMHEDALRILRMVRFAAELGFSVEPETWAAAKENVGHLIQISRERIRDEFFRILLSDQAYGKLGAPARGLLMLRDLGALKHIIPILEEGAGFTQNPQFHRYDVLDHQIATCACAPPDIRTRLAALLHDIAKPEVYREDGNMYRHPYVGAERATAALQRLRAPNDIIRDTSALIESHMFDLNNTAGERAVRRRILKLGAEQFNRLADLREADFVGSGMGNVAKSAVKWRKILGQMMHEEAPLTTRELAVDGRDIMKELKLDAGPQVGWILSELLVHAAAKPTQNNYRSLVKYARMLNDGAPRVPGRQIGRTVTEDHKGV